MGALWLLLYAAVPALPMVPAAAPMAAIVQAVHAQEAPSGPLLLRVPLHGSPGVPEVISLPGEVRIEVPDGKIERGTTPLGEAGVSEVVTQTSHSRHRAVVVLRLRDREVWPRDRVEAVVAGGMLTLRIRPSLRPSPASGRGGLEAKGTVAPQAAAPVPAPVAAATPPAPEAGQAQIRTAAPVMAALPVAAPAPRAFSEVAVRVAAALSLLGLAAWLALRQRKRGQRDVRPAAIDIVASRMLGRSQRLVVVDVDQKRFLLAASDQGGVRLVAPIDGDRKEKNQDPLQEVFSDMLADVVPSPRPTPASGRGSTEPGIKKEPIVAKVPIVPSPARGQGEGHTTTWPITKAPRLQLVEENAESEAGVELRRKQAVPMAPRHQANEDGQRSADVAGLLALRRNRPGAGR